ncbi:LINE-1 reverse transcriptase [Orchesella cincta]|uniref:LINE-1 reverse transcriptase n=1 Tax=Orchesella cincta TaxID=48709 RepID=A0A1D2M5X0_ORCCI|nr:LINE-1 reverse transcriptase [Orchesella cincta]
MVPEKEGLFQGNIENELNYHFNSDITLTEFTKCMKKALYHVVSKNVRVGAIRQFYGPRWFENMCHNQKTVVHKKLKRMRAAQPHDRNVNRLQYISARREYQNLRKAKRTLFENRTIHTLSTAKNGSDFYKALSYFRPKTKPIQKMEYVKPCEFREYFKTLFNDETKTVYDLGSYECKVEALDKDFSYKELNAAIKMLARNKAPGPDSVTNEMWKALDNFHRLLLLDVINDMYRKANIDPKVTTIAMSPIYKKGSKNNPANYRPISLVNTGLKLITILLSNRLSDWCDQEGILSQYQAAYRKGYGCETHVFTLNAILQSSLTSSKKKVFALFVDLSKAFDSIPHKRLWERLKSIGVSTKFLQFIIKMYSNINAFIKTPFGNSNTFPIQKSVLQGESLSPKLFTIFIDEIVNELYKSNTQPLYMGKANIHILLYADDIILLVTNAMIFKKK